MLTIESLNQEQLVYFISKYPDYKKMFTHEQLMIMVTETMKQFKTKKQYVDEMMELGKRYLQYTTASRQFPCRTIDPDGAVAFHIVRKIRDMTEQIHIDMRELARDADKQYDISFRDVLDDIREAVVTDGRNQISKNWNLIKDEMYPETLWPDRILKDHNEAIQMDRHLDEQRRQQVEVDRINDLMAGMTVEDRELLQGKFR